MGLRWLIVLLVLLVAPATGALAAQGGGKPQAEKKTRLGTFAGTRHENATVAGRTEAPINSLQTATFKVKRGRLYVTVRPSAGPPEPHPWKQSFKITSDEMLNGVRVLAYERDAHPVVRRNNERALDKNYGGTMQLTGMSGSGRLFVWKRSVEWNNVGDGELKVNDPRGGAISARYDWSETFKGASFGGSKVLGPKRPD